MQPGSLFCDFLLGGNVIQTPRHFSGVFLANEQAFDETTSFGGGTLQRYLFFPWGMLYWAILGQTYLASIHR